jgi:ribonuclease III
LTGEDFEAITGHRVGDLGLYVHAMRHRSLLRGRPGAEIDSNERLEYLGDAVLGFVVAEHLYGLYPQEDEGFLTRLRAKLVNGKALARYADQIGLMRRILISENLQQQGGTLAFTSIMADALEALIGALFLDRGIDAARDFVVRTVLDPMDLDELMSREDNHKSVLLEYAQARGWAQPTYRVRTATGPSHERRFTVEVLVKQGPLGVGEASSKKQAEQLAAKVALQALREGPEKEE